MAEKWEIISVLKLNLYMKAMEMKHKTHSFY